MSKHYEELWSKPEYLVILLLSPRDFFISHQHSKDAGNKVF